MPNIEKKLKWVGITYGIQLIKKTCFCDNEMFSKLSFILEIYSKNKPIYSLDNKDIQKVALEIGGEK